MSFTLAHLSDPHLGPLPEIKLRDIGPKRVFGLANWHRQRNGAGRRAALAALTDDIRDLRPDHIAVTGDLINLGLSAEITAARAWLEALGSPERVSVVPGNHDAYMPGAIGEYIEAWGPYMAGDGANAPDFPYVRRRGPVAILGVSTAIATAPLMATGRIGQDQAEALAALLKATEDEGLFRVVLIHHPPAPGGGHWHRRLIDGQHFRHAIADGGAELILHGHDHRTTVHHLPGPAGPVPIVGASSAASEPRPHHRGGSYHLFRIGGEPGRFTCDMEIRAAEKDGSGVRALSDRRLAPHASPKTHAAGMRTQA